MLIAGIIRVVGTCLGDPVHLTICCCGALDSPEARAKVYGALQKSMLHRSVCHECGVAVFDCVKLVVMVPF